jgi:lactoylglutathione lyase
MSTKILLSAAIAFLVAVAAVPAIAADALLIRMGGVGLNVSDIDRSLKFYTDAVGLKVAFRLPGDGPIKEVALCVSGNMASGEPFVVLTNNGQPPAPGHETFGRVIINTPDSAALAARATRLGYSATQVGGGSGPNARPVYFLTDPDGYRVEVYQASTSETKY